MSMIHLNTEEEAALMGMDMFRQDIFFPKKRDYAEENRQENAAWARRILNQIRDKLTDDIDYLSIERVGSDLLRREMFRLTELLQSEVLLAGGEAEVTQTAPRVGVTKGYAQ